MNSPGLLRVPDRTKEKELLATGFYNASPSLEQVIQQRGFPAALPSQHIPHLTQPDRIHWAVTPSLASPH